MWRGEEGDQDAIRRGNDEISSTEINSPASPSLNLYPPRDGKEDKNTKEERKRLLSGTYKQD